MIRDFAWHDRSYGSSILAVQPLEEVAQGESIIEGNGDPSDLGDLFETGRRMLLDVRLPIDEQVRKSVEFAPDYLCGNPPNIEGIAIYCRDHKIKLSSLQKVVTFGGVVSEGLRELCLTVLNAPIIDNYSTNECGYIAHQCPDNHHYHINCENVIVEVLDDYNRPCRPGEIGCVHVTTLHNYAMPLIRYRIGDYAEVGPECSCGRGLPTLAKIQGRIRNRMLLPEGGTIWPPIGACDFRKFGPVQRYQCIQTKLDTLRLKLVCEPKLSIDQENALKSALLETIGYSYNVEFEYIKEFSSHLSWKFEEFICEVEEISS